MTTEKETTATIHVKASKLDPVYQDILVRKGEYYHPQFFKWFELPAEWESQADAALAKAASE